jgi:hypothetical protein
LTVASAAAALLGLWILVALSQHPAAGSLAGAAAAIEGRLTRVAPLVN